MPGFIQRLDRLEKRIRHLNGGVCRQCYGHPIAAIRIMYESDPMGPGLRRTGEYILLDAEGRVTDDLRCRQCGAEAQQTHLISLIDVEREPAGRRICAV